ncbi:hypothetical protein EVAR_34308_1 [Eumeta japonica]|uniref:Uncharacterized protein n=1 Tax=Eumeta variegata TaxID=151549 RepID=A0A4C1VFU8_EUMVA|nr:hypothetical protein EVAR_34308_1 [Eumeta japonica]
MSSGKFDFASCKDTVGKTESRNCFSVKDKCRKLQSKLKKTEKKNKKKEADDVKREKNIWWNQCSSLDKQNRNSNLDRGNCIYDKYKHYNSARGYRCVPITACGSVSLFSLLFEGSTTIARLSPSRARRLVTLFE